MLIRTSAATVATFVIAALVPLCCSAETLLDQGYREMYNLDFSHAHQTFAQFEKTNPTDAMGPVSDAAAYLFTEFDRLGILKSDYLTKDESYFVINKPKGDPEIRKKFDAALELGDKVAATKLKGSPGDEDAMLAETMSLGLHANYDAMIDRHHIAALSEVKESREHAQKLLSMHPDVYDAYIAQGIENYLLSQKNVALRWFLRLGGAQTNREVGLEKCGITAEKGHYFKPYAQLLLAIADLRDNNRNGAKQKLTWLSREYPGNHLYREELERLVTAK